MQLLKKTFHFLLYNQVLVALPVAIFTLASFNLFNLEFQYSVAAFVYFATYTLYNFHRLYGVFLGNPADYEKRHWYTVQHFEFQCLLTIFSLLVTATLFLNFTIQSQLILCLAAGISLLYSVKLRVFNFPLRIRDIPFLKVFVIAFVVAAVSVFIPYLEGPKATLPNSIWWYYLEHFLFLISITIPFDARDVNLDAKYKLTTLPVFFGKPISAVIATLFFAAFSWLYFFLHEFNYSDLLLLGSILFVVNLGILHRQKDWFYTLIIEGTMVLYFILVVFF